MCTLDADKKRTQDKNVLMQVKVSREQREWLVKIPPGIPPSGILFMTRLGLEPSALAKDPPMGPSPSTTKLPVHIRGRMVDHNQI